jgi:hypothetical protein
MKNIPDKIYLQIGKDVEEDADFDNLVGSADISWCEDRIYKNDIEYARIK